LSIVICQNVVGHTRSSAGLATKVKFCIPPLTRFHVDDSLISHLPLYSCNQVFFYQISNENGRCKILKDGVDLAMNERFKVKKEGTKVSLHISKVCCRSTSFFHYRL